MNSSLARMILIVMLAHPAKAGEWEWVPGLTSAELAHAGWLLHGAAGMSWPDGRQAVVTYWQASPPEAGEQMLTMQCFTYFDASARETGDACRQPIHEEPQ